MDRLMEIASRYNLKVIEDCAHAIEAEYKGRKAGAFGDFGCFSFYATKNVTTGEGGMVIAQTESDIGRVKTLALHGMSKDAWRRFSDHGYIHYAILGLGFKYNMMDLQAAIGIHQLRRVESNWRRRRRVWEEYNQAFARLPISLPAETVEGSRHALHLYTILVDERRIGMNRDAFLDAMTELGIGVGVHYMSIPEHPYYASRYGWRPEDYPVAMRIGRETVSLPLSARLTDTEVSRVISAVASVCERPRSVRRRVVAPPPVGPQRG
jgi:dTDP-4-amino-4,6-dideoxygalactose transaminase